MVLKILGISLGIIFWLSALCFFIYHKVFVASKNKQKFFFGFTGVTKELATWAPTHNQKIFFPRVSTLNKFDSFVFLMGLSGLTVVQLVGNEKRKTDSKLNKVKKLWFFLRRKNFVFPSEKIKTVSFQAIESFIQVALHLLPEPVPVLGVVVLPDNAQTTKLEKPPQHVVISSQSTITKTLDTIQTGLPHAIAFDEFENFQSVFSARLCHLRSRRFFKKKFSFKNLVGLKG